MLIVEYQLDLQAEGVEMILKKVKRIHIIVRLIVACYFLMTVIPQFCLFILTNLQPELEALFVIYFLISAFIQSPLKLGLSLYIWKLALRYLNYFDNLNQTKCKIIIHGVLGYISLVFANAWAVSLSQFLSIFLELNISWYDSIYYISPYFDGIMYLLQGCLILTVMHVLNDIALEQDETFEEPMDTLIQNNKLLDGSQELPFDQTIDQTINDQQSVIAYHHEQKEMSRFELVSKEFSKWNENHNYRSNQQTIQ